MSVRIDGKMNLLSGHYQDIVVSENTKDHYCIKVTPNQMYHVRKLDDTFSYPNYDGISDLEKIRSMIDSYLYNNTIFMLTNNGKVKYHSGSYLAINAYDTWIDGCKSISRAMYLKIITQELTDTFQKITKKYEEDRIRHFNQILNCREIFISLSLQTTSYYIDDNKAYINLLCSLNLSDFKTSLPNMEVKFLEELLIEFIRNNGYSCNAYGNCTIELHNCDYSKTIELDDHLMSYVLEVCNKLYKMRQEYHNITIEEYLSSLNEIQDPISSKTKK